MTLQELREVTKDLPDNATIYIFTGTMYKSPVSIKTVVEDLLFLEGETIPETMHGRVEIRLGLDD
jgi:hypothetical protein